MQFNFHPNHIGNMELEDLNLVGRKKVVSVMLVLFTCRA